ncbi:uncharacterized protein KY384_002425 [Bacidia gigantensis]|uniref:uncharacterized protein n=1 Tax=Bacidia gigantensis TaxID=2732470 RepID=UPI001D03627C|nr:uncharacterized protein KY384_002425 [Bacidia gigantensis]KAG8532548.1 hypothetical protein KY384_002425 [Bacidia gigantensis]
MAPSNATTAKPLAERQNSRPNTTKPSTPKATTVNGAGRSPSLRGGVTRPGRATPNRSDSQHRADEQFEEEARAQNAALLDELRESTRKAETASEELQRQLNLLQARLEESQQSQSRLEDHIHEQDSKIEDLEMGKSDAARQKRDMQTLYESERTALFKEKEEQNLREDEMQGTIQRLKENLAQREARKAQEGIKDVDNGKYPYGVGLDVTDQGFHKATDQFAPPISLQRIGTDDQSRLVATKDRVIESLRLELAEAQIKIMEMDGMGGGQMHEVEKKLMEIKIENARLLEDNESFQLLLSEKTLNGEFSKADAMQSTSGLGSLAEELGSEDLENAEDKGEPRRRLELENKSLKDQNRALAVYIEKIIGRLLQHKDFDTIFDKNPELLAGAPHPQSSGAADVDKDLPPPPPPKDNPPNEGGAGGFLQRARSVVSGPGKRPRPVSQMPPTTESPLAPSGPNEDPSKAPRIPLGRSTSTRAGHGRSRSDMPNVAPIVNQMYRGLSPSRVPGPLGSPGLSPSSTAARTSFFSQAASLSGSTQRAVSSSRTSNQEKPTQDKPPGSSSNSTFSDRSGGVDGTPNSAAANNFTGAVMTQNRLRPLRLVQENKEMEGGDDTKAQEEATAARKRANRTSWMPNWMAQRNVSNEQS